MIRSKKHLDFIRSLECVICSAPNPQAAHLRIRTDGGTGLKPSDCYTTPLCAWCHRHQHDHGEKTFWAGWEPKKLCLALYEVSGDYNAAIEIIQESRNARRNEVIGGDVEEGEGFSKFPGRF
jgi:hypothetical protein